MRQREKESLSRNVSQVSKIKLGKILDESTQAYKKEIEIVTCGHLNPNNFLRAYKNENEKLIDLLEEYDVVHHSNAIKKSKETQETEEINEPKINFKKQQFVPEVVPNPYLNVTKADQFKTFKMIDQALVERSFIHVKGAVHPKADKLKDHLDFLQRELSEIEISDNKPSWDRLQVYSRCFENIIEEFKTYGPILAKIKVIYSFIYFKESI